jgi:S-adenosylmethionine uptake transporter
MSDHKPLFGIAIMILAMALFATKDSIAKFIVMDLNPAQIIWMQFTVTFMILAAVTAPTHGWRAFQPTPFGWQLGRGLASVAGVGTFYWALSFLPLADATAMAMVAPVVVTVLSPVLLAERIGTRRILAVFVGFAGVLVILRPGFGGDTEGYLIALLSGVLFGLLYVGNRRLGGLHPPLVNIAHNVLFGVVFLMPVMPLIWVDLPDTQYVNFSGFLAIALVGQGLMVSAFIYAPASVIAPYQHTVIVFATVIGYLVFGTFPDVLTWAGIVMIVGAGVFIAMRESRLAESNAHK